MNNDSKDDDIVNIVACSPEFNDNLIFVTRNGKRIRMDEYFNNLIDNRLRSGPTPLVDK